MPYCLRVPLDKVGFKPQEVLLGYPELPRGMSYDDGRWGCYQVYLSVDLMDQGVCRGTGYYGWYLPLQGQRPGSQGWGLPQRGRAHILLPFRKCFLSASLHSLPPQNKAKQTRTQTPQKTPQVCGTTATETATPAMAPYLYVRDFLVKTTRRIWPPPLIISCNPGSRKSFNRPKESPSLFWGKSNVQLNVTSIQEMKSYALKQPMTESSQVCL